MSNLTNQPWLRIYEELNIEVPPFEDRTMGEYIAEHAAVRGDQVGIRFYDRGITYTEYDQLVSQLANGLTSLGVEQGDVVGIHLPNIPQYVVALAAVSRLGAIGSGVSPLLTPPEIAYQLNDARVKVVLTLDALAPAIAAMPQLPSKLGTVVVTAGTDHLAPGEIKLPEIEGVDVVSYLSVLSGQPETCEQRPVHWNDTFMIQYTGGTTGSPKGAELSVRTLMHNPAQYGQSEEVVIGGETTASPFPMFHIAGLTAGLFAARIGAQMVLIPDPRDIEFFCGQMKKYPPTFMSAVPALFDMLVQSPAFREVDFSQLKMATSGAAPLPRATFEAVADVFGQGKLTEILGMTETGPCYTMHPPSHYRTGSVGFPLPGADVRIMDVETGTKEMPRGEPGEIASTGPQTMKGYLNLPDESARALREMDGRRWMFSGDVGYMDEDGYVYLCDRAKDMLIVGGFKVFSVEVEDKLKSLPCIAASAVIGIPDEDRAGNEIVTLYVQVAPDSAGDDPAAVRETILEYCRENLAPYKVPKQIHFIDQIPLTAVGKIDKKKLRGSA